MGIKEAILHEIKEKAIAEGLEKGLEEGLEKGMEKGLEKGKAVAAEEKDRIIVRRGLEKGLTIEDIAFLADISIERVQFIIQELEIANQEEE